MGLKYKIEPLEALKASGYNTTRLRRDKLLSESAIQRLRKGDKVSWDNIEQLCALLNCQPGDLMEYIPDE